MPKSIWKDRKTGEIVAQDTQYDDAMAKEVDESGQPLYEPATEAEADAWEANPNAAEPFTNNLKLPSDVDKALADKIEATGVSRGEAIRRAANTAEVMKSSPAFPMGFNAVTISQGEPFGEDALSQIRTAFEGAAGGISMGIIPFLEGLAIDAYQAATDQPIEGSADIQRRREANPTIALTTDIGASLLQGGLSLFRSVRPAASLFTGDGLLNAAARGVTNIDIPSRVANRVSAHMTANRLGSSLAGAERGAQLEIADILTKERAGQTLNAIEKEILDVYRATSKKSITDILPAALTKKPVADVAGNRAIRERAAFMVRDNLTQTYRQLGYDGATAGQIAAKVTGDVLANIPAAAAGGATAGAIGGFTRRYGEALSSGDVNSMGEALGVAALNAPIEAGKGALLGGALAVAAPAAVGTISKSIQAVRGGVAALTEFIYPRVGTAFTDARPQDIKAALKAGKLVAESDLLDEVQRLRNSLQYQHDNVFDYVTHLDDIANREFSATPVATAVTALNEAIDAVQKKYMIRPATAGGKPAYDLAKLRKGLLDTEAERVIFPDGRVRLRVKLPPEIETLQTRLGELEERLINLQTAYNTANGIVDPVATARINALKARMAGAPLAERMGGLTTEALPYSPLQQSYARASPAFVGSEPMDVFSAGLAPAMSVDRNFLTPTSIASRDALRELGERVDQKTLGPLADFAIPAFLANQAGFSIAESAGVGVLASQAPKILFNPRAAIESYTTLQKALAVSQRGTTEFAKFLTTRGMGGRELVKLLEDRGTLGDEMRAAMGGDARKPTRSRVEVSLKEGDAAALYAADRAMIERLTSGDAIGNIETMFGGDADAVEAAFPKLSSGMMGTIPRQVAFINSKLPRQPQTWDVNRMGKWEPDAKEIYSYGLYSRYIHDPDAIYLDIAKKNYVPDQAIEVLQQVYPARYAQLRQQLFNGILEARESGEKIRGDQQKIIDRLLGVTSNGLTPQQIRKLQNEVIIPPSGKGGNFSSKLPQLEREGLPR